MSLHTGDTLLKGQYRILGRIGRGGFASVYHARDTLLGRDVAIKELLPSAVSDPEWVKRFFVEARATIELHHDNIVATHTLFAESGKHYLVMEYMPGGSLDDVLRRKYRLRVSDALRMARQVCEGLAYAHRRGIVHCDLKPENILFAADGTAKVADFGIAHVVSHGAGSQHWATTGRFLAGTLPYMSPEQVHGERSDPRIDLYALGALLYHTLTGRPYAGFDDSGTPAAMGKNIDLILHHQPAPPSTYNSQVPPWLDDLVLRLLAKRPEDRPDSADQVLALLNSHATVASGPLAGPTPPVAQAGLPKWARYAFLALLVVILGGALLWLRDGAGGPDPTPATPVNVLPTTVTATASPSATLTPSITPTPTDTPTPTATATDTPTPTPTPTDTPTPTPTPTPTLAPFPEGGRIAFASGPGDNRQICVMYLDDGGQVCLTEDQVLNESPAWSPYGERLAFHFQQDDDWDVYSMKADGSDVMNLTNDSDANDGSPSWSPDGSLIAFDSTRDGNVEIYVMNADGSGVLRLTENQGDNWQPAWSPDGSRIAFVSDRDGNPEIYMMDADGSNQTRLSNDPGWDESPAWSPGGTRIAFWSGRDGNDEIYLVNTDGTGLLRLTYNDADDGSPCWSPDGKLIAFDSNRDGNREIYVMNADGSAQTNLTNSPKVEDPHPAWWGPELAP